MRKSEIATVSKIVDEYNLVINKGSNDRIIEGNIFAIYELTGEQIHDPETDEDLGEYEKFKGKGKVVHVQEKNATIKSIEEDTTKKISKNIPFNPFVRETIIEAKKIPFNNPKIGDKAKHI